MKKYLPIIIGSIILFLLVGGAYVIYNVSNISSADMRAQNLLTDKIVGKIGSSPFNFAIADSEAEHSKGLSGSKQLPASDGLVFVYEEPGTPCMWMKDMNYAIDILWFGADFTLIDIENNVDPGTYPKKFCPDEPAQYVVELAAGAANKNQLKKGDRLDIKL